MVGVFVAADLQMPPNAVGLAILIGLVHGFFNGAALKKRGRESLDCWGCRQCSLCLLCLFRHLLFHSRNRGREVMVRVAGSWIAASGLLLLGWALHNS